MDNASTPDREGLRRWLENWQRVGPLLEQERLDRLGSLTDEEARTARRDVQTLWRPSELDDFGAELVEHQRWFLAARARATR